MPLLRVGLPHNYNLNNTNKVDHNNNAIKYDNNINKECDSCKVDSNRKLEEQRNDRDADISKVSDTHSNNLDNSDNIISTHLNNINNNTNNSTYASLNH